MMRQNNRYNYPDFLSYTGLDVHKETIAVSVAREGYENLLSTVAYNTKSTGLEWKFSLKSLLPRRGRVTGFQKSPIEQDHLAGSVIQYLA